MFPLAQRFVAGTALVSDAAIAEAQRRLWEAFRLIAEPGGATALAALLSGRFSPPADARIGVVVCGANTDPSKIVA
jgi:threonine dehydratase